MGWQEKQWALCSSGQVKVQGAGFPLLPDFGGMAHAYCDSAMDACIGDLLPWRRRPQCEDALRAYIIMSRVKDAYQLLIAQPYSPQLFRQGVLLGPDLLLRVLRDEISTEEAQAKWKEDDEERQKMKSSEQPKWPLSMTIPCRRCPDDIGGMGVAMDRGHFGCSEMFTFWRASASSFHIA